MRSSCLIALFVSLSIIALVQAHKEHHDVKRFPKRFPNKEGKLEEDKIGLDHKNCEASNGLCGVQLYELPKDADKHPVTLKVKTDAPVQICLAILEDKNDIKDMKNAVKSFCGFGSVELCFFQGRDKFNLLAVSLDNSLTTDEIDGKVVYTVAYSRTTAEECGKPVCRDEEKYCSKGGPHTGEQCLIKKFARACKATCSSIGIDYEECVAPTPKPTVQLTACQSARLAALTEDSTATSVPSCQIDGSYVDAEETDTDTGNESNAEDSAQEESDFVELAYVRQFSQTPLLYSGVAGAVMCFAGVLAYTMRKRRAPLSEQDDTPSAL